MNKGNKVILIILGILLFPIVLFGGLFYLLAKFAGGRKK